MGGSHVGWSLIMQILDSESQPQNLWLSDLEWGTYFLGVLVFSMQAGNKYNPTLLSTVPGTYKLFNKCQPVLLLKED